VRSTIKVMVSLLLVAGALAACGEEPEPGVQPGAESENSECDTSVREEDSGLKIKDIECGNGKEAQAGDVLVVYYTGKLEDGTVFDSSVGGEPFPFQLGAGMVIQGWDQGFEGMLEGGKRELTIPPEMGYGEAGAPPDIPPNATLVFEVELVEVRASG
jgi:FKBP-type peptidyl-prolyl cis-trans isomerase FkpA